MRNQFFLGFCSGLSFAIALACFYMVWISPGFWPDGIVWLVAGLIMCLTVAVNGLAAAR